MAKIKKVTKMKVGPKNKPPGEKKVQRYYMVKKKHEIKAAKAIEFLISERFS
jgi:hypothetical protein